MPETVDGELILRDTTDDDLPALYAFQCDPEAIAMAAFPAREWDAFVAHQRRIRDDPTMIVKTVVVDGSVVGNCASYDIDGRRMVGYWIGRAYWGRGIATRALETLLAIDRTRPIYAYVAMHNAGSRRVLEKCGFRVIGEERWYDDALGADVEEYLLELPA